MESSDRGAGHHSDDPSRFPDGKAALARTTKDEAWGEFWALICPGLVDLYRRGEWDPSWTSEEIKRRGAEKRAGREAKGAGPYTTADVRKWLAHQGQPRPVGRIPTRLLTAYEEAHGLQQNH